MPTFIFGFGDNSTGDPYQDIAAKAWRYNSFFHLMEETIDRGIEYAGAKGDDNWQINMKIDYLRVLNNVSEFRQRLQSDNMSLTPLGKKIIQLLEQELPPTFSDVKDILRTQEVIDNYVSLLSDEDIFQKLNALNVKLQPYKEQIKNGLFISHPSINSQVISINDNVSHQVLEESLIPHVINLTGDELSVSKTEIIDHRLMWYIIVSSSMLIILIVWWILKIKHKSNP
jgi:hypothetical protein